MYSRLFIRINSFKGCSLSQTQVASQLSQSVWSIKPTITRALHLTRDLRIFTASKIQQLSSLRSGVCKQNGKLFSEGHTRGFGSSRRVQSEKLNVNTEVTNNVYLYKYERPAYFKTLNVCAGLQLFFWAGIAYVLYRLVPKRDPEIPWKKYVVDNGPDIFYVVMASIAGLGGSSLLWTFTARSIRYIILNKGGKNVTLITYHVLDKKATTTIPVGQLRCKQSRKEMKHYMAIKMDGRKFFHILDKGGEFVNPTLFDYTVGSLQKVHKA